MALLKIYNLDKSEVDTIEVSDEIFDCEVNQNLFYEVVKMQLAKKRAGTHSVKRRGEVKGSTAKLFRQKGTGRARRGDVKAAGQVGGGSSFGPKPRDYSYKTPRKVRKGAMRSAISVRNQAEKLMVLDNFELSEIKTKTLVGILEKLGVSNPLIIDDSNENLRKSASNIPGVDVLPVAGLNVYDILNHDELLLTKDAVTKVEGAYKS